MGDDRGEASFGSKIDIYFNLREGHVYPLGLFRGVSIIISKIFCCFCFSNIRITNYTSKLTQFINNVFHHTG